MESLLEAGEEEGILEESDRELVRSAVEFGDKLVREVMTPRPQVFAVPQSITLERFLEMLKEHNFSRVPVYERTLDSITGIAFAHDLLQIADEEARTRTVASIQHPAVFVPETKRGYELLREMQREKQHMRIVIDEYGRRLRPRDHRRSSGRDRRRHSRRAREGCSHQRSAARAGRRVGCPRRFPRDQLQHLFGDEVEVDGKYEATTLGGLVSEVEGRIPLPGEVVLLEQSGLRIQVIASTDRRVDRLRIFPPAREEATALP